MCLCDNSVIFEDVDLKFCTHIHYTLLFNMYSGLLEIWIFEGEILKRKKVVENFVYF